MMTSSIHKLLLRLAVVLFVLAFPSVSSARPLAQYITDFEIAYASLDTWIKDSVDLLKPENAAAVENALNQINKDFPAEEDVEYGAVSIPVDNSWIGLYISDYSKETVNKKKKLILRSIHERIESIIVRMTQLENAEQSLTSKDEQKRRLAEILRQEEYLKAEEQSDSLATRIYKAIDRWIASLFPPKPEPKTPAAKTDLAFLKTGLQVMILGIAAAIIIFVIIRFGPRFVRRFKRESSSKRSRLILGEEIGPDVTTADLLAEAEALAGQGDIRGAIRKGYISLLFELSERKLIGLAKHKTNRDYLQDLKKEKILRTNVGGLTNNYERHWYGSQTGEDSDWEEFKQGYHETLKRKA